MCVLECGRLWGRSVLLYVVGELRARNLFFFVFVIDFVRGCARGVLGCARGGKDTEKTHTHKHTHTHTHQLIL